MRPTIGVAIPCYKHHVGLIPRCLASIEAQIVKPDQVVISCSSSEACDIPSLPVYSFPLTILTHSERRNAAENRNIAASRLTTDLVSFFDVDDVMHPQRLESIPDCDITLHSYLVGDDEPFHVYPCLASRTNVLRRGPTGCAIVIDDLSARIHHAHATVKREILRRVEFRIGREYERREDSLFCGDVLALPGITSVYIANPLSRYYEEGSTRE